MLRMLTRGQSNLINVGLGSSRSCFSSPHFISTTTAETTDKVPSGSKRKRSTSIWKGLALVGTNAIKPSLSEEQPPSAHAVLAAESAVNKTDSWQEHKTSCIDQWKEISDDQLRKFLSETERSKFEHIKKIATLNDEKFISAYKRLKSDHRNVKAFVLNKIAQENLHKAIEKRKSSKMLIAEHGRPKKPGSAVAYFALSNFAGVSAPEAMKLAAEKWKTLSEDDKTPFYERAKAENEKYYAELKAWEADMIAKGFSDLIAKPTQIRPPTAPKLNPLDTETLDKIARRIAQKWDEMTETEKKRENLALNQNFKDPFAIFKSENLEKIQKQFPAGSREVDQDKLADSLWKALAPADKEVYVSKFCKLSKERSATIEKLTALQKQPLTALQLFGQNKKAWLHLSEEERQKYISEARRLKSDYDAQLAALSVGEQEALKNHYKERETKMYENKLTSKYGRPKEPLSSFDYFAQSLSVKAKGSKAIKLVTGKWDSMSKNEKKPFYDHAKAEQEKYEQDLKAWKEDMAAKGLSGLIAEPKQAEVPTSKPEDINPVDAELLEKLAIMFAKPKPPQSSGFWCFMASLPLTENRENLASEKWEQMSLAEKKPFYNDAAEAMQKYRTDVAVWRKRMVEFGFQSILVLLDSQHEKTDCKTAMNKQRIDTSVEY